MAHFTPGWFTSMGQAVVGSQGRERRQKKASETETPCRLGTHAHTMLCRCFFAQHILYVRPVAYALSVREAASRETLAIVITRLRGEASNDRLHMHQGTSLRGKTRHHVSNALEPLPMLLERCLARFVKKRQAAAAAHVRSPPSPPPVLRCRGLWGTSPKCPSPATWLVG